MGPILRRIAIMGDTHGEVISIVEAPIDDKSITADTEYLSGDIIGDGKYICTGKRVDIDNEALHLHGLIVNDRRFAHKGPSKMMSGNVGDMFKSLGVK